MEKLYETNFSEEFLRASAEHVFGEEVMRKLGEDCIIQCFANENDGILVVQGEDGTFLMERVRNYGCSCGLAIPTNWENCGRLDCWSLLEK